MRRRTDVRRRAERLPNDHQIGVSFRQVNAIRPSLSGYIDASVDDDQRASGNQGVNVQRQCRQCPRQRQFISNLDDIDANVHRYPDNVKQSRQRQSAVRHQVQLRTVHAALPRSGGGAAQPQ